MAPFHLLYLLSLPLFCSSKNPDADGAGVLLGIPDGVIEVAEETLKRLDASMR